jgi:hypothetical protein
MTHLTIRQTHNARIKISKTNSADIKTTFSFINKIPNSFLLSFFYLLFYRISSLRSSFIGDTRKPNEKKILFDAYTYWTLRIQSTWTHMSRLANIVIIIVLEWEDERGLSRNMCTVTMTNHSIHYVNEETISLFMEQLSSV